MTNLAEMTGHSQSEASAEIPKETSKGTNGETGVAGNSYSSKKDQGLKREGDTLRVSDGERGRVMLEKDREKEKPKEKDRQLSHAQATKASRRTTSLLNLFMSNSQGRSLSLSLSLSLIQVTNLTSFQTLQSQSSSRHLLDRDPPISRFDAMRCYDVTILTIRFDRSTRLLRNFHVFAR